MQRGSCPPKAAWTGGFKAVGKTLEQAKMIRTQVQEFENAGAFAVEMEVVAAGLAIEITKRTSMPTVSLRSGGGCDAQYLFSANLLGENRGYIPRHAKTYRSFAGERDRLQDERVAAYREKFADVTNGGFPNANQIVNIDEDTLAKVWET
nr:3-methyl-2-oxobutanoate hydroxymethyltransferase [Ruegeria lacuscaerulensis]